MFRFAFIFMLLTSTLAVADATVVKAPRPHEAIGQSGCVRKECHADIKAFPVLHGPAANNACDACHTLNDVESHTFKVAREKSDLCTYCHEFTVKAMPVVHKPVSKGECLGCHDPHGGMTHGLLREKSVSDLCARCHEKTMDSKKFLHTPVKQGACDSCHAPHASRFPKLLDATGTDLCLACHVEFEAKLAKATFTHKALEKGCQKCHDAHGSNQPMSTTQPVVAQCEGCHEKIATTVAQAAYPHSPVTKDRACVTCHTPHGGDYAKLMIDAPSRTCMTCHKETQKTARGATIAAVPEIADSHLFKHGPLKDGACAGCHSSHGGGQPMLVSENYSPRVYQQFSVEKYKFCFTCHDAKLALEETTRVHTKFRDGERNLHYVHLRVSKNGESCRLCHETHAGAGPDLVRESVPYGVWNMPVRFRKTATGGSCYPGCHPAYRYDREKPAGRKASPPSSQPTTRTARADREVADIRRWTLRTVDGQEIDVPDGKRSSVIAFIRADSPAQSDVLRALSVADQATTQVVIVVCGSGASEAVTKFDPGGKWLLIADENFELSSIADIRGWPTTMVLRSDGIELVRVGGTPQSMALRLGGYLDFAGGKIDESSLEHRLNTHEIVTTSADNAIDRALSTARMYRDSGDAAAAERILSQSLVKFPADPHLTLELLRTLVDLQRGGEVLDRIQRLPGTLRSNPKVALLRARALVSLDRWDEAQVDAEAAASAKDATPDAHYFLGTVYEHAGNWQLAAKEYRAAR